MHLFSPQPLYLNTLTQSINIQMMYFDPISILSYCIYSMRLLLSYFKILNKALHQK